VSLTPYTDHNHQLEPELIANVTSTSTAVQRAPAFSKGGSVSDVIITLRHLEDVEVARSGSREITAASLVANDFPSGTEGHMWSSGDDHAIIILCAVGAR